MVFYPLVLLLMPTFELIYKFYTFLTFRQQTWGGPRVIKRSTEERTRASVKHAMMKSFARRFGTGRKVVTLPSKRVKYLKLIRLSTFHDTSSNIYLRNDESHDQKKLIQEDYNPSNQDSNHFHETAICSHDV